MAILGYSKLDAVNLCLRASGLGRASALDTGGASEAAIAEDVLDEISQQVQTEGLEENTIRFKEVTLTGAGKYVLDSDTLRVIPTGKDAYRQLVIRGDDLYDADNGTDVIGANNGTAHLTIIKELSFEDLAPASKKFIARLAAQEFQRRTKNSPQDDLTLGQESTRAEQIVGKYAPPTNANRTVNPLSDPRASAVVTASPFSAGDGNR